MIVPILGWAAALLASCVAIPQVLRLFRTRSTAGVSLIAWRLPTGGQPGLGDARCPDRTRQHLAAESDLRHLQRADLDPAGQGPLGWPGSHCLGPSVLLALITFGLDFSLGPIAFAIAAGLPSVASQLMQLHELLIAPKITGVSVPFLALNVTNQVLWLSWGSWPASSRSPWWPAPWAA